MRTRSPLVTLIVFGVNSDRRIVTGISRGCAGSFSGLAIPTVENSKTAKGIVIPTQMFLGVFIDAKLLESKWRASEPWRVPPKSSINRRLGVFQCLTKSGGDRSRERS